MRLLANPLHELLIDELEALGRGGDVHPVLQPGDLVAHARDDLAPGVLGLLQRQHVEFVDQGVPDLEADDGRRVVHRPAYRGAAVAAAPVVVDLLVAHLHADLHAPVVRHLLDGGEEDVADLRVGRREVPAVDAWPLQDVLQQPGAPYPGLP